MKDRAMRWTPWFIVGVASIALFLAPAARAQDERPPEEHLPQEYSPGDEPSEETPPKYGEYVYVEELPEALRKAPPAYPELARQAGVEGTVMVQALVGRDGLVKDVRVVRSIPMLDSAAVVAVRQWTFKPALANGEPVAVWVAVPVRFALDQHEPSDLAQSPQDSLRDEFDRYFARLQELGVVAPSEDDRIMRFMLIRTALRMVPPPRLPDSAHDLFDRGRRSYERCSCRDSAASALLSYQQAIHEAPWWGPPYLGAARMLQRLDQPRQALVSYRLYLIAEPGALETGNVLKEIARLERKVTGRP